MDFQIVRGTLTEKVLRTSKLLKNKVVLGDLGLLTAYLPYAKEKKRYKLGIIPHKKDQDSPVIRSIEEKYGTDCILINLRDKPEKIISQIAGCENIVSTALHGLIVADSLGVPNLWIETPEADYHYLHLNHFKFADYYSALGLTDVKPMPALEFFNQDISIIFKSYPVNRAVVEAKKEELYKYCNTLFAKS
jgi:hypothetical protein